MCGRTKGSLSHTHPNTHTHSLFLSLTCGAAWRVGGACRTTRHARRRGCCRTWPGACRACAALLEGVRFRVRRSGILYKKTSNLKVFWQWSLLHDFLNITSAEHAVYLTSSPENFRVESLFIYFSGEDVVVLGQVLVVRVPHCFIVYCQSPLGPVDPSFRALSGRIKFTVRRHKLNKDSLLQGVGFRVRRLGVGVRGLGFRV